MKGLEGVYSEADQVAAAPESIYRDPADRRVVKLGQVPTGLVVKSLEGAEGLEPTLSSMDQAGGIYRRPEELEPINPGPQEEPPDLSPLRTNWNNIKR